MKKTLVAALLCGVSVVGLSAGSAFAGEINGKGERPMVVESYPILDENGEPVLNPVTGQPEFGHVLHGKSECAFSGLNDEYIFEQPEEGPATDGFGRTQNWGQLPKETRDFLRTVGAHPGDSCNPTGGGPVEP
jgi:hypothetical protein